MTPNKVVVISPEKSSYFADIDAKLLNDQHVIEQVKVKGSSKIGLIKSYLMDIIPAVIRNDACFIWFADAHALVAVIVAKVFGKKSAIVVGGYEVSKVPQINYGNQLTTYRRIMTNTALKHADLVMTQSDAYKKIIEHITGRNDVVVIHPPVDAPMSGKVPEKKDRVVMVASTAWNNGVLKGVPLYNDAASRFDIPFIIIGEFTQESVKMYPNLTFLGQLPHNEVIETMAGAKVYCQLSRSESFGAAVVEAMSVGCIPVVSDTGALPDVIGDYGIVVETGFMEVQSTVNAIEHALHQPINPEMLEYVKKFSIENRKKLLEEAMRYNV